MNEQMLNLGGVLRAVARKRLMVVTLVIAGVAVGLLVAVLQRQVFAATARVVLPPSSVVDAEGRALRDIRTEAHIARSSGIIDAARKRTGTSADIEAIRRWTEVRAATDDVLEITVEAPSSRIASLLATALAHEYVSYANDTSNTYSDTIVVQLERHAAELEAKIRELEQRIAEMNARAPAPTPGSPDAARAAALLTPLLEQQLDAQEQLYSATSRIADVRLAAQLTRGGTRVLEEAPAPTSPARPRPIVNGAIGALVGTLVGLFSALYRNYRDDRLYRLREIADAVRAPVMASLPAPHRRGVPVCRRVLEEWEPTQAERLALRHAFALLQVNLDTGPANLTVATLAGDHSASLLAPKLAVFGAAEGHCTTFVVASAGTLVADLRLGCQDGAWPKGLRERLSVLDLSAGDGEIDLAPADLTVTLVTLADGPVDVPTWGRPTTVTLAVSSGFATPESLASAAVKCVDAGHRIRGVFVANPERDDSAMEGLGSPFPGVWGSDVRQDARADSEDSPQPADSPGPG